MKRCFSDTETFSETPIACGSYRYSEKCEVLLWSYAFDDGPIKVWDRTKDRSIPVDLKAAIDDPAVVFVFHNGGGFDRVVIEVDLKIVIPPSRIHDTMARAYAHGLPGSLDALCGIFNVPKNLAKDKDGKKLIQLFCKPRPADHKIQRATRETHPLEWAKFCDYAKLDIEAMRYLESKMPNWNYTGFEYNLWCLDQKINKKGFAIDTKLIEAAIKSVEEAQKSLKERTIELTEGQVSSATRRDLLLKYVMEAHGIKLPDMQASTLERRLEDPDLPEGLRELLKIRIQACTSSTAKYQRILKSVSSDGRLRGTLQWCGAAHTGRDCLAEGTLILVRTAENEIIEKPIECVLLSDMTWDGDEWVSHEGVVFSGDKDVIKHDGVVATSEHNVYVSAVEHVSFGQAKQKNLPLWRGNHVLQNIPNNSAKWS